ncbi:hypothetical protein CYMTET_28732 [Cymbomonas tetramitiformis]|uniref:Cation efflux protein transmembrane domain-containing protein n=1 Tax=Cymbomonas tetramitiformis TaxID=36881 RepID=A0AAE0KVN0_9CHLO|nr:hypothetical protein CYMTET_28732 [Cymbomonas tetramitiformis]
MSETHTDGKESLISPQSRRSSEQRQVPHQASEQRRVQLNPLASPESLSVPAERPDIEGGAGPPSYSEPIYRPRGQSWAHNASLQDAALLHLRTRTRSSSRVRTSSAREFHRSASASELSKQESTEPTEILTSVMIAIVASLVVNILLFVAKGIAYLLSGSLVVLSSLYDSFLDLLNQMMVYGAFRLMQKHDPAYPVGRPQLESVAALCLCAVMWVGSLVVIVESATSLFKGSDANVHTEEVPAVPMEDTIVLVILGAVVASKAILYLGCRLVSDKSAIVATLVEDHFNDVASNAVALLCAALASQDDSLWLVDPIGAIVISAYIIYNWTCCAMEQISHLVGHLSDPDQLEEIEEALKAVDGELFLRPDVLAYHSGPKLIVEVSLQLPGA